MKKAAAQFAALLPSMICVCCFLGFQTGIAQKTTGIPAIEKAYTAGNYAGAEKIWQADVSQFLKTGNIDTLTNYIGWAGKLGIKKGSKENAIQQVNKLVEKIKTLTTSPVIISQAYIEAGEFFGSVSNNDMGYKANEQALQYAAIANDELHTLRLANIENNMAAYAQRMGDISLSISHDRKALQWVIQLHKPDYEKYYLIYNSMGSGMYYISKLDSGIYFFNKALDALSKAQPTPQNKYYRPAIIQNNIAGIYGVQGKTTAGIAAMKATINYLKLFLSTKEPHPKKQNAIEFQFEATDNLAGIYKELGDYQQAQDLLTYSYQQKQKQLPAGNDAVFKSEVLLGQLYYAMREYDKAVQLLNSGLAGFATADGDYLFWQADATSTLALLYEAKKDNVAATRFYEKADSLYEESLQGEYDNIYLDFLTNAASFFAANGQLQTAINKANKGYAYIVKTQGAQTLQASAQLANLSDVYFLGNRYPQALSYADKALTVINTIVHKSNNLLDSVNAELQKPKLILTRAKAQYSLLPVKNVANLAALLKELEEGLILLERRKSVIGNSDNEGLLIADHEELLQFIKTLNLELFRLTKNTGYIDRMVGLHESGLYNRIRSRLDIATNLQFVDVPPAAQATEQKLTAAITTALSGSGTHDENMKAYFTATERRNQYQETIRNKYPRYYKMRYGSIFKSIADIQQWIPDGTTVIRYFYIGKDLYALVADRKQKQLYALPGKLINEQIAALPLYSMDAVKTGDLLSSLYQQLWAPLSATVIQKRVIIIPDGILYNLSFETLTPQKTTAFRELVSKSLLAKYVISYRYSLLLLGPPENKPAFTENFVAFAPGFTDEVKSGYRSSIKAGEDVDRNYLSLLPQPFTIDLAAKTQKFFGGDAYLNNQSTTAIFKANAGHHTIIHVGTHAESNNLHPEYSRLIFAKNTMAKDEENSLFLPDIYSCDLTSSLTVLTACESGKPGYRDGEGMISLAHAFNYAGSECILTGLWKIDEQVSTILIDQFYKNLSAGMPKDEALQQAKLSYLQKSSGRTAAPQYWAGLVLMGDTSPLKLEPKKSYSYYWIAGAAVVLSLLLLYVQRRVRKSKLMAG